MATRSGIAGKWAIGGGLTRPVIAYLVVVTLGVWVFNAIEELKQGGDLVRAGVTATSVLRDSLDLLPMLAVLLLPAMVHSIVARSILGRPRGSAGACSSR
jgi:hypothetical protein